MTKLPLLFIVILIGFPQLGETIFTPALPNMSQSLKIPPEWAQFTLSIYFMGFSLGVSSWGFISDIFGRRPIMLLGIGIYAFSCLLCGSSTSIEMLYFWRILQAFGASVGSVITITMMRDLFDGKKRNQMFALMGGVLSFVPAMGTALGGFLSDLGWEANFFFIFSLASLLFLYSLIKLPETRSNHIIPASIKSIFATSKKMLCDREIWFHTLLVGACNGIFFGFYAEAPFLFINLMGFSAQKYGMIGLLNAFANLLGSGISHRLHERWSTIKIITLGTWIVILGSLILTYLSLQGAIHAHSSLGLIGILLLGYFIVFVGVGLVVFNSLSIALVNYQRVVGTAGSIFGFLYYLLIMLFTGIVSIIHTGTPLPLSLFFLILGSLMFFFSLLQANSLFDKKETEKENSL